MSDANFNLPPAPASGLDDNIAGGLAYFTIIPALIFLFMEPYRSRPFVRFHCFQSLAIAITGFFIALVTLVPFIRVIAVVLQALLYLMAIVALIMAFMGKKFPIPGVAIIAEKLQAAATP